MEKNSEKQLPSKKKYRKPTVRMIPLRPDEAVLGACKSSTSGGQNVGGTSTCTVPIQCSTPGS